MKSATERRRLFLVAIAASVALVCGVAAALAASGGEPPSQSAAPSPAAEQNFRTYLASLGRTPDVVAAGVEAAKLWCDGLDAYDGNVDTMVRVITAGETPTGATAVLLEETFNGMGIYICPQHRDALRAWTTTH